jgi:hypothetical protein
MVTIVAGGSLADPDLGVASSDGALRMAMIAEKLTVSPGGSQEEPLCRCMLILLV